MKKLLNALLMLSVMAAVVPAQAVQTRRQKQAIDRVALVRNVIRWVPEGRYVEVVADEQKVQNQRRMSIKNSNALIAAAFAAGVVANLAVLYYWATTVDCGEVAQAYCAGAEIAPDVLQACQQYLPSTLGCWF